MPVCLHVLLISCEIYDYVHLQSCVCASLAKLLRCFCMNTHLVYFCWTVLRGVLLFWATITPTEMCVSRFLLTERWCITDRRTRATTRTFMLAHRSPSAASAGRTLKVSQFNLVSIQLRHATWTVNNWLMDLCLSDVSLKSATKELLNPVPL